MDPSLILGALGVGVIVGMTGMGGGALMTPMLVLIFGVPPLTAVSSDLVASAVMKPAGAIVHLRHKTVALRLVGLLCIGSVPAAFCGVLIIKAFGDNAQMQEVVRVALGCALILSAILLTVRAYLRLAEKARSRDGRGAPLPTVRPSVTAKPLATIALGAAGGLIVGMTSVGSGSLIIIGLMMLYRGLRANQLVGTDLVQAVPLVASAAIGHAIFGDLDLNLTWPLLIGSIPGAFIGAQISARISGGFVRRILAFVLLASGLKMIGLSTLAAAVLLAIVLVVAPVLWMLIRRHHGFPALVVTERRRKRGTRRNDASGEQGHDAGAGRGRSGNTVRGARRD